ncbi:MAG: hypothetical protein QOH64_609 [Acidimicrobiaceae bacterium]|jgi:hypothetical protein
MLDLHAVHDIEQLKYRYVRFLDLKRWDDLGALLTEDCEASYAGGKLHYEGRDAIMAFLRDSLGMTTRITTHHVHHPEIEVTSDTEATGMWGLEDIVIDTELSFTIRGTAIYEDEYVKGADGWRIRRTGYTRTYEEFEPRDHAGLKITQNRWA